MFIVILESHGNPDFGQDANQRMSPRRRISVFSLTEASQVTQRYIDEWNLGGGNFSFGQVWKGTKQIAKVSYNGRIWDMDGKEIAVN